VPDGFFDTPDMQAALAAYDFGSVFRAVRAQGALSQEDLGFLIGIPQSRISAVERGAHRLRDVAVIARIASALGIPGLRLGFRPPHTSTMNEQEVRWLDRRDFFATVAAITLGVGVHPDLERLEALLPSPTRPALPRQIGLADVDAIAETTAAFRLSDYRHGGGLSRAAAVAQLDYVIQLHDVTCSDRVRAELLLATADLAKVAAWMSYDVEQHEAARRLWMIALDSSRRADHPRSADLTVMLLLNLAHQALHLDRPGEALRLAQLSSATITNQSYPVSASTHSYVETTLAWCHASLGEAEPTQRSLEGARRHFAEADPATAPPWAAHVVPAEAAAQQGHALFLLSKTKPDYAGTAIEQLRVAVDGYDPAYTRSRAVNLPGLSGSYFYVGDLALGIATGHAAVTAITSLSSTRAYARLRTLAEIAAPFSDNTQVAELCRRIHLVTARA
jgi:transcriptional regulator with XRE-family HTH domain